MPHAKKLLSPEKAAQAMHMSQLMLFLGKEVAFAQEEAWEEAKHMTAVQWWLAWGAEVPVLQSVALKVLSQPVSVGGVERVCMEHFRLDTKQVAEQDGSCHRKEASDGAHVAKDRDDEGVRQVGGGLATTYMQMMT